MATYSICTLIDPGREGGYRVRVLAIPCDGPQRTAPEERSAQCENAENAAATAERLALELSQLVVARGDRLGGAHSGRRP